MLVQGFYIEQRQRLVQFSNLPSQRVCKRTRVSRRPRDYRESPDWVLSIRKIYIRNPGLSERTVGASFDDADYFNKRPLRTTQTYPLANCILIRPIATSHGVVDDRNGRRTLAVAFGEIPACEQRYSHRLKV